MKRLKRTLAFTVAALTGATLVACGGGGGGSGSSAIPYAGNTAAAIITEENATEIALAAYSGGEIDSVGVVFPMSVGAEESESSQASRLEYLLELSRELREMAISGSSATEGEIQAQSYSDIWPSEGSCGGTFEWSGTSDPYADKGSVTLKFDNYCDYGTILSGTVRIAWSMTAFTVSFDQFSIQTQNYWTQESFSAGGKVEFRWSESNNGWNETVTINMVLIDHLAEKEYKFENYRLSYTFSFDDSDKFILSGRYYDAEFGRVDISTPVPVLTNWSDGWPLQGVIQFNGANASVRIVFVADGARIEWRPSLSGDNWQFREVISRSDFDIWF